MTALGSFLKKKKEKKEASRIKTSGAGIEGEEVQSPVTPSTEQSFSQSVQSTGSSSITSPSTYQSQTQKGPQSPVTATSTANNNHPTSPTVGNFNSNVTDGGEDHPMGNDQPLAHTTSHGSQHNQTNNQQTANVSSKHVACAS